VRVASAPSLLRARWWKLLWNIPFNGIAVTAGGATTDVIMRDPDLRAAAEALMREVATAGNAELVARGGPLLDVDREVEAMLTMTDAMVSYRSSTVVDFL